MNDFLHKNIEALGKTDPITAARVFSVDETRKYEVFVDNDPANINIIEKETKQPLYVTKPVEESVQKVKEFTLQSNYPYLYFFGLGNGIFYKMLLSNSAHARIVVLEPELELLYIGLHFADFSKEIEEKRFVVMYTEDADFVRISSLIRSNDAKIYSRLYDLNIFLPYYGSYQAEIVRVNKLFIRAIEDAVLSVGNDSKDALMGIEHNLKNLPTMLNSPSLINLVENIKNSETAIIVSTGPSLHKQLALLKEIQDFVTIFCIDASFPILCREGIKPDIVLSMERIPLTSEFYKKSDEKCFEGVIFELTSIVHEELINSIKGGTIQMSMRPFGYTAYMGFDKWGYIGIGMSAANMAYELAVFARFTNVIFIGQDLAYGDDGATHTKGHIINEERLEEQFGSSDLYVEKYGGNGKVKTAPMWKMFLNFFERDIAETPYPVNVINSTEGGARIHGTKEIPFAEALKLVSKEHKKERIKLQKESDEYIKKCLEDAKAKVKDIVAYSTQMKEMIEKLFLDVTAMTEKLEKLNKEKRLEELNFQEIYNLVNRIDDVKDLFLDEKFVRLFIDAVQSFVLNQELEIAKIRVKYTGNDEWLMKAKYIDWLYAHKQWLFWLAGGINAVIEIVKRGSKEWAELEATEGENEQE